MHTLIKIDDIPDHDYEGYYWYSDQSAPEMVYPQRKLDFKEVLTLLPFVVEGNFYAEQEKVSIQIRHIDGEYRIAQFDLKGLDNNSNYPVRNYIAHRLKDEGKKAINQYKMMEAWEEIEDPLLEGMKTLKPTWAAFCGFVK